MVKRQFENPNYNSGEILVDVAPTFEDGQYCYIYNISQERASIKYLKSGNIYKKSIVTLTMRYDRANNE
jgi:hypothetical protein